MSLRTFIKDLLAEAAGAQLPFRLLAITTISIFIAEAAVMFLMHRFLALTYRREAFLDSLLLVVLLSPVLYLFLFRPLLQQIRKRAQAESGLQMERDKLKSMLDAMEDGVCIANKRYVVEYTNPVLERACGAVGSRRCHEYLYGLADECPWCDGHTVFAGTTARREWVSARTNRAYHVFETPLENADGTTSKLEILHDITDRKNAEEALRVSETQLRLLSSQLLTAQETERRRIAGELHDQMGQDLALLKIRMRSVEQALRSDQTALKAEYEQDLRHIDRIIENVRHLSRDLSPYLLEDLGLTAALRWMIDNASRDCRVQMDFDEVDLDRLFSHEEQVLVYRIFQEALTNIVKHAGAANLVFAAKKNGGAMVFRIEDDGRGFDPAAAALRGPAEKGMGLATMEQRAKMLEGTFEIRSGNDGGTTVSFTVPLKQEKERRHVDLPHRTGR